MKARSVLECPPSAVLLRRTGGSPLPLWIRTDIKRTARENPNGIPSQSPGLRGTSYLGKKQGSISTPTGLCHRWGSDRRNPAGVVVSRDVISQGSSCLATLGWRTQSLWDWSAALLFALLLSAVCVHAQSF